MKKFILAAAAAGAVTISVAPAMAAPVAHPATSVVQAYSVDYRAPVVHQWRGYDDDWGRRGYDRGYGRDRWDDRYDRRLDRRFDRRQARGWNGQYWRGNDGRYYCRRDNGTTGLLIGGAAGALAGSEIAGRGDRTTGAVIGGIAGALLGRSIDRNSGNGFRCR